jgi:Transposase DNA-binding/Transposase Tn5 dimerisation domain/Transposase DDE domain
MSFLGDSNTWAREMFGDCDLGDRRRTERLVKMAGRVAENPSGSLPDQMGTWAELKAAYRLFDSPQVSFDAVARPHWQHTRRQARGRTLVLCDTTELDFGIRRDDIAGLGPTGNGTGRGFLLHNALMVDAATRTILGVAGQVIHYRPKTKSSNKETSTQKLKRPRESEVWGRVIVDVGPPPAGVEYVFVCDRGADNFEVFCHSRQQNSHWVIRAKARNRKLLTRDGQSVTLGGLLPRLTLLGTYELHLRARPGQPARTAKIEVRSGSARMPAPRHTSPWIKSLNPQPVDLNVVRVREVDAPKGTTPIEWVLYTSLPIDTFEQVWEIIGFYEARWLIEEYHKALKSGCRVTHRQLKTAARLEALVGLMSVVGVRLLQLKTLSVSDPNRPARQVVPLLWLQMLKAARQKLRRVHDLTSYEFYREVAKLGGFLGRTSDGEPGWITIWKGWEKLNTLVRGAEIAIELKLKNCG